MLIYRVEHERDGKGPFLEALIFEADPNTGHTPNAGPTPSEEGVVLDRGLHFCGCESTSQLRRWFHKHHIYELADSGYELVTYEVDSGTVNFATRVLRQDAWQVTFDKGKANPVDRAPVTTLLF